MVSDRLRAAPLGLLALVGAHAGWLLLGLPGAVVVSDVLFVAVPGAAALLSAAAARRATGRARTVWWLFAVSLASRTFANVIWGWYEVALARQVPTPSPTDVLYTLAQVLGLAGVVLALTGVLRNRRGAVRVVLDVVLVAGSLLFVAWTAVLAPLLHDETTDVAASVSWLYPALSLAIAAVAFAVMSRVPRPARLPWGIVGGALLVRSVADTVWAYENVTDGFGSGSLVDAAWIAVYGALGIAAMASAGTGGLDEPRVVPARWESLGVYLPPSCALLVAAIQQLEGELDDGMTAVALLLFGTLMLRQVLFVVEHETLALTLETRIADATAELRTSEERFRSIVANISDVVLVLDAESHIRYQSPSAQRLLGYDTSELLGQSIYEIANPDDLLEVRRLRTSGLVGLPRHDGYVGRVRRRDGSWRHVQATITNLLDEPAVQGVVLALRDVHDEVELQERLRHQAFHDALTGLANRAKLQEELERLLADGRRPSLLLLDLDEFKAINDTAGHDLGDQVLVAVARRLLHATRADDIVSRLGGDEFAVVLADGQDGLDGLAVADRVLAGLRLPLSLQGRHLRCLASIGVATAGEGTTAADLLRDADTAMYVAKANGKGRVEHFTPAMRATVVGRQVLADLLRRAVAEDRLVLHYQPVLDLAADRFVGAEALLRLRGEDGVLVSPADFIPVAEETGAILEIGEWVLRTACLDAAGWQALRPDGPPLDVAVNVSTRQLQDPGLARAVGAALAAAELPAALLTLEITEGAIAGPDPDVEATLAALRQLGVRLSIDDFGAGYSSLGRLRHLPVDELKIDRSFVAELADEESEAPLIDAILALAARLGLSVVAEGIETHAQAVYLRVASCDRAQGYLYAEPLPADRVATTLAGSPAEERARARAGTGIGGKLSI